MAPAIIEATPLPAVDRKFWAILGLSAALHATLLFGVSWERPPQSITLPPITATIRLLNTIESEARVEAVAPPAVPEKVRAKPPQVEPPAPPMVKTARPAMVPAPIARPDSPVVATTQSAQVAPTAPLAAPGEALPSSAPVADPPPTVAATAAPAGGQSNREALDHYRQSLTNLFAGQHAYPRVAALRGWEGEVRLRLKVARKGNLLGVILDRSSGFDVLDQHAMAMIEAFGNLPPLPESLDSNEIQVVVPINYKLRKTT
jgi:periplasmic protein TonB